MNNLLRRRGRKRKQSKSRRTCSTSRTAQKQGLHSSWVMRAICRMVWTVSWGERDGVGLGLRGFGINYSQTCSLICTIIYSEPWSLRRLVIVVNFLGPYMRLLLVFLTIFGLSLRLLKAFPVRLSHVNRFQLILLFDKCPFLWCKLGLLLTS